MEKTPLDDFRCVNGIRIKDWRAAVYLAHEIVQQFSPGKRCITDDRKANPEFVWVFQQLRELIRRVEEK